jgi:hypothetical protein
MLKTAPPPIAESPVSVLLTHAHKAAVEWQTTLKTAPLPIAKITDGLKFFATKQEAASVGGLFHFDGLLLGQSGLRTRLGGEGPVAIDPKRTSELTGPADLLIARSHRG